MFKILKELVTGTQSILTGMAVTARWMLKPPVTVSYPMQRSVPAANHKGRIQLVIFPESGTHDCIACLKCEKICPSACISIAGEKPAGGGQKRPTRFDYKFQTCSLCSLCIEVCPTNTLEHSPEYNLADEAKQTFSYNFLADIETRKLKGIHANHAG